MSILLDTKYFHINIEFDFYTIGLGFVFGLDRPLIGYYPEPGEIETWYLDIYFIFWTLEFELTIKPKEEA